jgi:phosphate transport system substrate-binding protein
MRHRTRRLAVALAATSLLLAACGGTDETDDTTATGAETDTDTATATADEAEADAAAEGDGSGLSGTVQLDGSSTVGPLTEVAAELYMQESDNEVRVTVAISGTGGGFEKFCRGETDGNDSSRPIKDSEIELCEENDISYDFVQAANDALSVLINNDAPVECLTTEQVTQIWDEGSSVATWGDVDGLDVPEDFADEPLTLYGPGTDSGTFDFFT